MNEAPQVVSVSVIDGATVKVGWFARRQLLLIRWDTGRFAVGYYERYADPDLTMLVELAST